MIIDCEDCGGIGWVGESSCCGAELIGDKEDYICGRCKEHTEDTMCETCNGKGEYETPDLREDEKRDKLNDIKYGK